MAQISIQVREEDGVNSFDLHRELSQPVLKEIVLPTSDGGKQATARRFTDANNIPRLDVKVGAATGIFSTSDEAVNFILDEYSNG